MKAQPAERFWVALVAPEIEENLGLRYLAAALEAAGIASEIVPFNRPGDLATVREKVMAARPPPALLAVSLAFQWRAADFIGLAVGLRQAGYRGHITAGGHFGSFAWSEILTDFPELDSICLHEAEGTLVELARALQRGGSTGELPGLANRDASGRARRTAIPPPADLAALPWPDRRGDPSFCLGHPIATLIGSRGCYASCAFCCIAAWHRLARGARFRLRPVEDLAEEMAWLHHERGRELFIFHDDNFFLPREPDSLARIHALADELEKRGVERFATVVKARPPDVTREVFAAMQERLGLLRLFLGVESACRQGLGTLGRGVTSEQNHAAMRILSELGIYACFNLLIFDPDTSWESLETNLAFMQEHAESPFNFGRVELYAGTPLLERMRREGRCRGDYLVWSYRMATPEMERVFQLALRCFHARNFAPGAPANRLMGTRFDVEVARAFHPESFQAAWIAEARALSRRLATSSVRGLRRIMDFVRADRPAAQERDFLRELAAELRTCEAELQASASDLERRIRLAVGAGCQHSRPKPDGWEESTPWTGRRTRTGRPRAEPQARSGAG